MHSTLGKPFERQTLQPSHRREDALKLKVVELYKSKDRTLPANYRPISLLPILAKVFDTGIINKLMAHLLQHKILSLTQYAFRPNSGCTMALQAVINNIYSNTKPSNTKIPKPTVAVYVDLSKAYDTIEHSKLIDKLQTEFNFTPSTVQFFRTYFQSRQQSTHTQHSQSTTQTITHGTTRINTFNHLLSPLHQQHH